MKGYDWTQMQERIIREVNKDLFNHFNNGLYLWDFQQLNSDQFEVSLFSTEKAGKTKKSINKTCGESQAFIPRQSSKIGVNPAC